MSFRNAIGKEITEHGGRARNDRLHLPGMRGVDDPHRDAEPWMLTAAGWRTCGERRRGEVRGVTFWREYGYVQGAGGNPWQWEEVDETRE